MSQNPDEGLNGDVEREKDDEEEGVTEGNDEPDESSSKNKRYMSTDQPEILRKVIQESKGARNDSKKNKSIVKEWEKLRKKLLRKFSDIFVTKLREQCFIDVDDITI